MCGRALTPRHRSSSSVNRLVNSPGIDQGTWKPFGTRVFSDLLAAGEWFKLGPRREISRCNRIGKPLFIFPLLLFFSNFADFVVIATRSFVSISISIEIRIYRRGWDDLSNPDGDNETRGGIRNVKRDVRNVWYI